MNKGAGTGFTIVELLIVVVVIAILAAITIVSYNGITNQANDASVKTDLAGFYKKLELYHVKESAYPGTWIGGLTLEPDISKQAYAASPMAQYNFLYCFQGSSPTSPVFATIAMSKSGNVFYITQETGGVKEYSGSWEADHGTMCQAISTVYTGNIRGYAASDIATGPWRSWTGVTN